MTETKHTPGPWKSRPNPDNPQAPAAIWIDGPNGVPVADVKLQSATEANARLIASAPDLLVERDRLRAALEKIEQQLAYGQGRAALTIARDALAKAGG